MLDIDLDFFVAPPVYGREKHAPRPLSADHSVWSSDRAAHFLRDQCGVTEKLPGFVTETHDQLFFRWRDAIERGVLTPPFHVTHVDAHADLGKGDIGYKYLMTDLLFQASADRPYAVTSTERSGITEGNFLLYAVGCQWISDLIYVFGDGGGSDEFPYAMKSFDGHDGEIELPAIAPEDFSTLGRGRPTKVQFHEPAIPYRATQSDHFAADQRYDFICLTRSPAYAPPSADPLFDLIRDGFIV